MAELNAFLILPSPQPPMDYNTLCEKVEELYNNRDKYDGQEYVKQAEKLVKIARYYNIHNEIQSVLLGGKSLNTTKYAYNATGAPIKPRHYLPLRNPTEIKQAAQWLSKWGYRLSFAERSRAAAEILSEADHKGVKLDRKIESQLYKIAGLGVNTTDEISKHIFKRAKLLSILDLGGIAREMETLAEEIRKLPMEELYHEKRAHKLAQRLDEIDKNTGLTIYYGRDIEPPEEFIFGVPANDIHDYKNSIVENVKTGKYYHKSALAKMDVLRLEQAFGPEFADEMTIDTYVDVDRIGAWLKTASKEEAELFDYVAQLCGIKVYGEKLPQE